MKKIIFPSFCILFLILQLSFSSALWSPLFLHFGISGKVIENLTTDVTEGFNLTIFYSGYQNYTDYEWKLAKTDNLSVQKNFYWKINDFAEAIKIKSSSPILISQSNAILSFKQISIGSCFRCNEISINFEKKSFVKIISAIIKGNSDVYVYLGQKKIVKRKFFKDSVYVKQNITENRLDLGKLNVFIPENYISNLKDIKYMVAIDNFNLKAYFDDTRNETTNNLNSSIIIEKLNP